MIIITQKGKVYKWDYKRLIKNLVTIAGFIYLIVAYLYVSNQDYLTLVGK